MMELGFVEYTWGNSDPGHELQTSGIWTKGNFTFGHIFFEIKKFHKDTNF